MGGSQLVQVRFHTTRRRPVHRTEPLLNFNGVARRQGVDGSGEQAVEVFHGSHTGWRIPGAWGRCTRAPSLRSIRTRAGSPSCSASRSGSSRNGRSASSSAVRSRACRRGKAARSPGQSKTGGETEQGRHDELKHAGSSPGDYRRAGEQQGEGAFVVFGCFVGHRPNACAPRSRCR